MKPRFEASPANKTCVQGENVTLTCNVSGIPLPEVTWAFEGRGGTANSFVGGLELYNVQNTEHERMYTCLAENKAGRIKGEIFLTVDGMSLIITLYCTQNVKFNIL